MFVVRSQVVDPSGRGDDAGLGDSQLVVSTQQLHQAPAASVDYNAARQVGWCCSTRTVVAASKVQCWCCHCCQQLGCTPLYPSCRHTGPSCGWSWWATIDTAQCCRMLAGAWLPHTALRCPVVCCAVLAAAAECGWRWQHMHSTHGAVHPSCWCHTHLQAGIRLEWLQPRQMGRQPCICHGVYLLLLSVTQHQPLQLLQHQLRQCSVCSS